MMLSGTRWQSCDECGGRFAVLLSSTRTVCLQCQADQPKPSRKPGRPRKYKNGEERRAAKTHQQRNYRHVLDVEKTPQKFSETKDLLEQKSPLSHHPLTGPSQALKSPLCENGGVGV